MNGPRNFYRLFDSHKPEVTRYIGVTRDPELRLYQHRRGDSTGLVCPWVKWCRLNECEIDLEVIESCHSNDENWREIERQLIAKHGAGNKWLLNRWQWQADKVFHGVPVGICEAYYSLLCEWRCRKWTSLSPIRGIEKAFPRIKLFSWWGVHFEDFSPTTPTAEIA